MMTTVLVAVPAYNEALYVGGIVSEAKKVADKVIVLDDGSTDGTACQARAVGATVIQHSRNQGYGRAIQDILGMASCGAFDTVLVTLDADAQHDPKEIPLLVKAITDGYDLAIGRRSVGDIPKIRRVGGAVLRIATRLLSGTNVTDSQCGFRAYSQRATKAIEPMENGMAVSSEIVALASWAGLRITEIPISVRYTNNRHASKLWKQGFYTLWRILVMITKRKKLLRKEILFAIWMLAAATLFVLGIYGYLQGG